MLKNSSQLCDKKVFSIKNEQMCTTFAVHKIQDSHILLQTHYLQSQSVIVQRSMVGNWTCTNCVSACLSFCTFQDLGHLHEAQVRLMVSKPTSKKGGQHI